MLYFTGMYNIFHELISILLGRGVLRYMITLYSPRTPGPWSPRTPGPESPRTPGPHDPIIDSRMMLENVGINKVIA